MVSTLLAKQACSLLCKMVYGTAALVIRWLNGKRMLCSAWAFESLFQICIQNFLCPWWLAWRRWAWATKALLFSLRSSAWMSSSCFDPGSKSQRQKVSKRCCETIAPLKRVLSVTRSLYGRFRWPRILRRRSGRSSLSSAKGDCRILSLMQLVPRMCCQWLADG